MGFINGDGPLDEIIDKHVAAMGGRERLMSLATVRMEGGFAVQGDRNQVPGDRHQPGGE
jgi:hypothetical protein